ncbi:MAG: hypothetical protein EXS14_04895 [Planctomycetes bacterium]|nr:hypothetical protein [Planctomycetota bacterium]
MLAQVEIEIAVDAPVAAALHELGVLRMELCADLACDGLTPSRDMLQQTRRAFPGHLAVLVRRTPHSFLAKGQGLADLVADILMAKELGADSIVAGVLRADSSIDEEATLCLIAAAAPCTFTFHRAFDRLADLTAGYRLLRDLQVNRILTSGGASTALLGLPVLRTLGSIALNEGGPTLMAGGGIRAAAAMQVAQVPGVVAIHRSGMLAGALDAEGIRRTLEAVARA